jgi:hypothetical protein
MRSAALSRAWAVVLTVGAACALPACGAFADAAGDGEDGKETLSIAPTYIVQGVRQVHTISFIDDPPWMVDEEAKGYLVRFDIEGDDISAMTSYDGRKKVTATLEAFATAAPTRRLVRIEARYQQLGKPQVKHEGWGVLYVVPLFSSAASADGGDGSDGGTD